MKDQDKPIKLQGRSRHELECIARLVLGKGYSLNDAVEKVEGITKDDPAPNPSLLCCHKFPEGLEILADYLRAPIITVYPDGNRERRKPSMNNSHSLNDNEKPE